MLMSDETFHLFVLYFSLGKILEICVRSKLCFGVLIFDI